MKGKILLAGLAIIFLMSAVPMMPVDGAEEANYSYYVEGYVAEGGGSSGKIPMIGVNVSIRDQYGIVTYSDTDESGYFKVGINNNANLEISFTIFGYTIISCPNTSKQAGSEYLNLTLSNSFYNSITRTYTITSAIDDMQCALMGTTSGTVRGTVSYSGGSVEGATVTLVPIEGEGTYATSTDERGAYEISCPTGSYRLTVTSKGFNESDVTYVNVTSNPSTISVVLEKSEVNKHLGLDTAHILMLFGVIVGMLLAVLAWFLSQRKDPKNLEIVDDSIEEDDDIRHP